MITLMMDTSFRYLNLALYQDDTILVSFHEEAFKSQSERIMVEIDRLFNQANLQPNALKAIVLTDGPGSYTGLRISLTIAKVLASIHTLDVYRLSSLQAMAGLQGNIGVIMDARANRVYTGHYNQGVSVQPEKVMDIEEARSYFKDIDCVGDADLMGQPKQFYDVAKHILDLKAFWVKIDHIDSLVPRYLKEY